MAYKKAMVADFDGTLYRPEQEVPIRPEDVEAIRAFQSKGYLFGVCSGRMLKEIRKLTGDQIHFDFAVTSSGACVYGLDASFEIHNEIDRIRTEDILEYVERHYRLEGNLHIADNRQITDISFHPETEEEAERLAHDLQGRYFSFIEAIPSSTSVNVIPLGSVKGLGIRNIQRHYGIETMYSVADSVSALSMFRGADKNYAVAWGEDDIIDDADQVVDSVAEALKLAEED